MTAPNNLPRWSIAFTSSTVGAILLYAAWKLPWRDWTAFALITFVVAAFHLVTALAAVSGSSARGRIWRAQALVALSYQVWITFNLLRSASYVAAVYGSMGEGIGAGLLALIAVMALLLVPTSIWGLAVTGGVRWTRAGKGAAAAAVVLSAWSLHGAASAADFEVRFDEPPESLRHQVQSALHAPQGAATDPAVSLMRREAVECPAPPVDVKVSIVATFLGPDVADRPYATSRCIQGEDLATTLTALDAMLSAEALPGPVKLDLITAVSPLRPILPIVDSLAMRPALDGVCEGARCLMPWQLFAAEAFSANMPFPAVPDFRFGIDPWMLRDALVWPDRPTRPSREVEGLVRVATASFVRDPDGTVHALRRLRTAGPAMDTATVHEAMLAAEGYILDAQLPDGRFKYILHPMTGQVTQHGFALARQAGTTLVLCELATDRARTKKVVSKAIEMMVSTGRRSGDLMALAYPTEREHRRIALGSTALASIAMLSCRDLVGDRFDHEIGAMTRFLLALQREDGGFNPSLDMESGNAVPGPDPLFAVGQAVYALSLLERVVATQPSPALPEHAVVREAVERAMSYTAEDFWDFFGRDFFWVEENWHCLAARASLQHHRHEGYERFCLDYATFKARLVLDEDSDVDPDYIGGVNVGNLNPPATTATSGLSEALAAAAAIARFRGEGSATYERALSLALPFVMHQQWTRESCFACTTEHRVVGAFSEHIGSPQIRIDFVQHALASLGHGGRILGVVDGSSLPSPMDPSH